LNSGQLDRALAQMDLVTKSGNLSGEDYYNLACFYSRAAGVVRSDERRKSDERSRLFRAYVADGIGALKKAADTGCFRQAEMREAAQKDSDLEILRGREEFRRVVRSE